MELLGRVLPRHLEIIYEINQKFINQVRSKYPKDKKRIKALSLIEEQPTKTVRMTHLAIVGSHTVNGVAKLHTEILKTKNFKEFHEFYPGKFQNKTNGITPRLWLKSCNPELALLITRTIGSEWVTHLETLKKLIPKSRDEDFRNQWREIKNKNKARLSEYIFEDIKIRLDPDSLFDVQIKRVHEYKRQLLCVLHAITLYNRIKEQPADPGVPRSIIFAGKAAPGYDMAKLIIKLINSVAEKLNGDPQTRDRLKMVFIPNYSVNKAEGIIPGADLSEQISTAGMEASGTGNMKMALNGALTIGTMDGANIEIREQVGEDNIFIFGLRAEQVEALKKKGYRPHDHTQSNPELKQTLDMIGDGTFSPNQPDLFKPIIDSLLTPGEPYLVLADYKDYVDTQKRVEDLFKTPHLWTEKSILNSANMGKFSSDRAIQEYCKDIWKVEPCAIL